jgi:mycothiol synthase
VAGAEVHKGRAEADVHPDARGLGIGTAILGWTEGRTRKQGGTRVTQTVTDANTAARALFERHGYAVRHTAWILQIAFEDPPPAPDLPDGIRIRTFDPARDARSAYRLIEDAFNEWEDREPQSFEEWEPWLLGHGSFAPAMSPLAFDGDELVGAALSFDYDSLADEGWVQQLATRASHRHAGIARALLQTTFGAFHARGKPRIGLSTDSRTGALSLYERVGMHVRRSYSSFAKDLSAG